MSELQENETLTETLTAEERDSLECSPHEETTKLLRLYDAALARAEALRKANAINLCRAEQAESEAMKAESRLADATALLEWGMNECEPALSDFPGAVMTFLEGITPAPAAECHRCAVLPGMCEKHPAPAAESEPALVESADGTMSYELRTVPYHDPDDLARIAELEARYDAVLKDFIHEGDSAAALRTVIAQAVAELERAKPGLLLTGVAAWHVDRALAILKGTRT